MPNTERPRARPKYRNRTRIQARASTPEDRLESHLQQLFEEQDLLQNMLISRLPKINYHLEDMGAESNYEFDAQDEDGNDGKAKPLQDLNFEPSKESVFEYREEFNDPVVLAEDVLDLSNPPELEEIPVLPPRRYIYPRKHHSTAIPLPSVVGKCTPPKLNGQGFDPPFPYPDFIAKNQESRMNYIFNVVDSLVPQMEHFLKLGDFSIDEGVKKTGPTGTVPKSRPPKQFKINQMGHAKYTITVSPRFKEPKQHNRSKNKGLARGGKVQSYRRLTEVTLEPEFDLDCEFGMEQIEKFRANKVPDEFCEETGTEKDAEALNKVAASKIDPFSIFPCDFWDDFPILEPTNNTIKPIWLNKNFDKRSSSVRPDTPITRPCSPDDDAPSTSAHAQRKLQALQRKSKETSKSTMLSARDASELSTENKRAATEGDSADGANPVVVLVPPRFKEPASSKSLWSTQGPPPLTEYQRKVIRFVKQYRKNKKRQEIINRKLANGEPIEPEPLIKLRNRNGSRAELKRMYSYVPIKQVKVRPKLYKAWKRQLEWQKAERKLKRIRKKILNGGDYLAEDKLTKEQIRENTIIRLNIRPMIPIVPQPTPKAEIPELPDPRPHSKSEAPKKKVGPPERLDRGQRLKNLLMDELRLLKQEKLHHLVLPENPLRAVYLPILGRRKNLAATAELPKSSHKFWKNEPEITFKTTRGHYYSAKDFSAPSTDLSEVPTSARTESDRSSNCSFRSALSQPAFETSTGSLYYDAKMPQKDFPNKYPCLNVSKGIGCKFAVKKRISPTKKPRKRGEGFSGTENPITSTKKTKQGKKRNSSSVTRLKNKIKNNDFRRFFDIDEVSVQVLHWMGRMPLMKGKGPIAGHRKICQYLEHFYWERLQQDGLYFHWFVNEGFFPAHYLIKERTPQELETLSHKQLDDEVLQYINRVNKPDQNIIRLSYRMAHVMVTAYFWVLFHVSTSKKRSTKNKYLLRCRFAISIVETFQKERNKELLVDPINCELLMKWALKHESRVNQLYDEPLSYAEERSGIQDGVIMRTPNMDSFKEFYHRHVMPKPDALAINPMAFKNKRLQSKIPARPNSYSCPIKGCKAQLVSEYLMSHFLAEHCRRIEELWLSDRMIQLFYPGSYPPTQVYCLCVIALLPRMPTTTIPIPRFIANEQLPSKYLYFAEHVACFLMYAQVRLEEIKEKAIRTAKSVPFQSTGSGSTPPSSDADAKASPNLDTNKIRSKDSDRSKKNSETLFIFWLATSDFNYSNIGCRLYVYCQDRSVKGNSLLNLMKMSEFSGVSDMVVNNPNSYLAIDYSTMVALTKDFKELVFIEIRYIDTSLGEDSGDEKFDL
ncbi:uncharacterized protein LOC108095261 [Drosophila ficusphila]|uniref:uncharacterized protein LOC108095261 n=1 Tax=Drosophila ficusphila TaxID=30025 RepID=UPI0007E5C0A4|nr:uncharacterized protein LOC108095261 [Drosophila ficusphila]